MSDSTPSPAQARQQSPPPSSSSSSSSETPTHGLDLTADDTWEDIAPDTEDLSFVSLFSDASFPDLDSMLEHDRVNSGFDLKGEVARLELDFYGCVRLVNYVRSEVKKGVKRPDITEKDLFDGDEYLKPVLDDDAVLFSLDDLLESISSAVDRPKHGGGENNQAISRVTELEAQLETLQHQFAEYRSAVEKTLDEQWSRREAQPPKSVHKPSEQDMDKQYFDSYSYYDIHETMLKDEVRTSAYRDFIYDNKHLFANRIVLDIGCGTGILSLFAAKAGAKHVYAVDSSEIITKAREIVTENCLQDKITCIRGRIEDIALPVVPPGTLDSDAASASSTKRGKAHVDIIVSEWFGYCLLYENMLDSVLHARDTYLSRPAEPIANKSTAVAKLPLMVPSHTTMHIAPLADPDYIADHITFWTQVYGFSMAPMLRTTNTSSPNNNSTTTTATTSAQPYTDVLLRSVPTTCIPAASARFKTLDLYTCRRADLEFDPQPFSITLDRPLPDGLDGWVLWFDVFFLTAASKPAYTSSKADADTDAKGTLPPTARGETWPGTGHEDAGVAFTTGPSGKETHWMQGCLMIARQWGAAAPPAAIPLAQGQVVRGAVGFKRSAANTRELEIEVEWEAVGTAERGRQVWYLR